MELWQAMAALGQHRHPDYWVAPFDSSADKAGRGPSGAIPSKGADQRIAESRDLFAARRAAARGDAPPPQPDRRLDDTRAVMGVLGRIGG